MYHSPVRSREGEHIEEVVEDAIEATATSEAASRPNRHELRIQVRRGGSEAVTAGGVPVVVVGVGAVVVLALIVAAVTLI